MPTENPGGGGGTGITPPKYQQPPPSTGSGGGTGSTGTGATGSQGDHFSHQQLENLWGSAGGKSSAADVAAAIAQAESQGWSGAIDNTAYPDRPDYHKPSKDASPEFSIGLWQINLLAHGSYTQGEMLLPKYNAQAAVNISKNGSDFGAWSTYNDGSYKQYLTGQQSQVPPPPGSSQVATPTGAKVPAKSASAWNGVTGFFDSNVPKAHSNVSKLADSLVGIFGG